MQVSDAIKDKIYQLIYLFETGKKEPNFGEVTILRDGLRGRAQVTFGKMQTTEDGGGLAVLLRRYSRAKGKYSEAIKPYLPKIGKGILANDKSFIKLLELSGYDDVMRATQQQFFDDYYYNPALKWATMCGFTQPLSLAVIFDSYIHSGGIRKELRNLFAEQIPVKGGNEKRWIIEYVRVRRTWLARHSNPVLRNTVYRCDAFQDAFDSGNWDMNKPIHVPVINKILV